MPVRCSHSESNDLQCASIHCYLDIDGAAAEMGEEEEETKNAPGEFDSAATHTFNGEREREKVKSSEK